MQFYQAPMRLIRLKVNALFLFAVFGYTTQKDLHMAQKIQTLKIQVHLDAAQSFVCALPLKYYFHTD